MNVVSLWFDFDVGSCWCCFSFRLQS